jgi:hypothetical protein
MKKRNVGQGKVRLELLGIVCLSCQKRVLPLEKVVSLSKYHFVQFFKPILGNEKQLVGFRFSIFVVSHQFSVFTHSSIIK